MNKYADKFDKGNKLGLNSEMKGMGNMLTFDFKNGFKELGKGGFGGAMLKKVFK